jgi:hypothetical protein
MDNEGIVARFPAEERYFSLFQGVQTVIGVHPVSYTLGTGGTYPME